MSQGCFLLHTIEKRNEVENLKRVDASVRAGVSATGPSDTPKDRPRVRPEPPRRPGKTTVHKSMGGGWLEAVFPGPDLERP
jgi:hypothetical protein